MATHFRKITLISWNMIVIFFIVPSTYNFGYSLPWHLTCKTTSVWNYWNEPSSACAIQKRFSINWLCFSYRSAPNILDEIKLNNVIFFFTEMRQNVKTLATTFSYHWKSMEYWVWTENFIFSGTNVIYFEWHFYNNMHGHTLEAVQNANSLPYKFPQSSGTITLVPRHQKKIRPCYLSEEMSK